MYGGLDDGDDANDGRAQDSPGRTTPRRPLPLTSHITPAGEPTSPLLRMKKRQDPHQRTTPMQAPQADQDIDMGATCEDRGDEQGRQIEDMDLGGQGDEDFSGMCSL